MENTPVNYMGLVTRRPEPVIISQERYEELLKKEQEYKKLKQEVGDYFISVEKKEMFVHNQIYQAIKSKNLSKLNLAALMEEIK